MSDGTQRVLSAVVPIFAVGVVAHTAGQVLSKAEKKRRRHKLYLSGKNRHGYLFESKKKARRLL